MDVLLSGLPTCQLDTLRVENETIIIEAHTASSHANCPDCAQPSTRVHSRYVRRPKDVPWATIQVQWHLQVRRFRCLTPDCPRKLFTERLPAFVQPSARRTERLTKSLAEIALALGGAAGARLSAKLGMASSPSTLLRIIRRMCPAVVVPPRAIGIDEWAWRKGRQYGTILVDLERHRVVDLLPDCSGERVTAWLKANPTIEVIARDRSGPFANAATEGAPAAIQVADRWHLLKMSAMCCSGSLSGIVPYLTPYAHVVSWLPVRKQLLVSYSRRFPLRRVTSLAWSPPQ